MHNKKNWIVLASVLSIFLMCSAAKAIPDFPGGLNVSSGNLGIGTNGPSGKLNVNQNDSLDIVNGGNIGSLNLTHPLSGGMSAITFKSTINWPSDGGYLSFYDNNATYAYWGAGTENAALVLGTTNDGQGGASDVVVLKSQAAAIIDAPSLLIPNGSIGIGTASPDSKLSILGSTASLNASDSFRIYKNVASYNNSTSNSVGTVKIVLPYGWTNTMISVKITGYDYSSVGAWDLTVSGYNYQPNSSWYNISATTNGRMPFTSVRLAYDSALGRNVILLGNTGTALQYPKIAVSEVIVGHSTIAGWGSGWSISQVTTESNITNVVTPTIDALTDSSGRLGIGTVSPNDTFSIGSSGNAAPSGSTGTGHNYTSTYISSDKYALANYGLVETLVANGTASSNLWGGTKNGNIYTGDAGAGQVGIGTTNPGYPLHLYKAAGETGILTTWGSNSIYISHGGWGMGAGKLGIGNGSSPSIVVDANNSTVGVGTVNPGSSTKLNVAGRGLFTGGVPDPGDGTASGVTIGYNGSYGFVSAIQTGIAWRDLGLGIGGTQMYLSTNGNIGVGTTGPSIKLAVGDTDTGLGWAGDGQLDIYSNNVNTISVRSGSVGIGIAGPAAKLDVRGNTTVGDVLNLGNLSSVSTSAYRGITWESSMSNTDYAIYKPAGAWTQPLKMAFYTGIRIGANNGYGGTKFYNSTDMATELMSVGNGDNNVRIANNLYTGGTVSAGAFSGPGTGLTAKFNFGDIDVNAIGDNFVLEGGSTGSWSNRGPSGHNGGAILHVPTHPGGYYSDLWFDTSNNKVYSRSVNAGSIGGWDQLIRASDMGSVSVNTANSANTATNANWINYNNAANGNGQVQFMQISSNNTAGDDPTGSWVSVMKMNHGDGDTYYNRTLAFDFFSNDIYTRYRQGGTANAWKKIVLSDVSGNSVIAGTMTATGFIYNSDVKLKKNINTIDNALAKILQLRGVSFNWKKDNSPSVGLIAQEVETVFPELVSESNGIKSVQYGNLVAPLIEAVKEQQKEIESLNGRIKILEAQK